MTDYQEQYRLKLTTAQEAVKCVKSGDWVDYGHCVGMPVALDKALAARSEELYDVNVRGSICLWIPEIMKTKDAASHFTWNSWHFTGYGRKMAQMGLAYYMPIRYSEIPRYYRDGNASPVNVAMFQVTPMDANGNFNFGPSPSHMMAVCETADVIIVEVNKNMPRCLGGAECDIPISMVDMIVEGENPPIAEMPSAGEPSEIDRKVAELIVEEIPDGACLQLGIGGMPNAVGALIAQSDLKDLGVHTEMLVDSYVDMFEAGKITGAKKQIDRFRMTYTFAAGSKKLYDFLDNNPTCMGAPVDYTNDDRVISKLDNFISINNVVDVDLFAQIGAESAGYRQISGAGGQLDFVLGAYMSRGGKSFLCMSSTFRDKDGTIRSRIKPTLDPGTIVTDTRANVHFLVTEFGKVNLKGLSTWQKAERIISIAHPDFRDELIRSAEKMNIWRRSNKR
ncbi:MAG: butyryl-CoA:acetate CoA-transferase [Lachnospiraceae bacterium]|nr:butyryl-CoA:acetate CoA-transferase [Lachnospiraceae bacterium]